ncbi:MerR family DNA-binding transcriptional regulator [Streptomyces sp. NPDC020965]
MHTETKMCRGRFAERVGANPRSLRYSEQQGLIPAARNANGYPGVR